MTVEKKTLSSFKMIYVVLIILMESCYLSHVKAKDDYKHNSISKYYNNKNGCHEPSIEQRERNATAIFTGTIRDLEHDWEHPDMMKAKVEIKRIIKGGHFLHRLPHLEGGNHQKIVTVEGIGDTRICRSFARKYDTRIFLVNKGENGELKLNSSLERITLENIEKAEHAVDVGVTRYPYRTRSENTSVKPPVTEAEVEQEKKFEIIIIDHCREHKCSHGAECFSDPNQSGAICKCQEKCSSSSLNAVCGSDDVTYESECHLRQMSCNQRKDILITANKSCDGDLKDPCKEKICSFGARCVPSLDGLTARCQCPEKCDNFGDSVGSEPVCGSDGNDYANMCQLMKRSCEEMKDIERRYFDKCDPCHGFECQFDEVCQLDSSRRPVCRCGEICPMNFDPVCSSDGKTFVNECVMKIDACKRHAEVRVLFRGECRSGLNPCSEKICSSGQHCYIDESSNEARCSCPPECQPLLRSVCGNNGRTYDSECHLIRQSCLDKEDVTTNHVGYCDKPGPCSKYKCLNGGYCILHNGHPMCTCPHCSEEYEPICGSDNISYPNECKMKLESCKTKKAITIRYRGRCLADICAQKKCEFNSVCEIDDKGSSQCICPRVCPEAVDRVCSSDGLTYSNECELQLESCKQQKLITVFSVGACECDDIVCEFGSKCQKGECVCVNDCETSDDQPICADNGVTFPNECALLKAACVQKIQLEVLHPGSCDEPEPSGSGDDDSKCDESTCQFDGRCEPSKNGTLRCHCGFNCDALRAPVCGSDGKTYGNECQLKEESCKKQVLISVQSMDNCEDIIDEELCDGEPPMVNPVTSREYNCQRGKDICPAGSYCHKLDSIARCCKEVTSDHPNPIQSCADSKHGCCSDGFTSAPGPNNTGCPNVCQCNSLGSLSTTCDPVTRQCTCRPGVGGIKCDRCNPNFWGLPKIAEGNRGCQPCGCNIHGSTRDDCEQMTGRCVCRLGFTGQRCDTCPNGKYIGPNGCSDDIMATPTLTCAKKECHFGAICEMSDGSAECFCPMSCPSNAVNHSEIAVCGSDGQTYGSICLMKIFACRIQRNMSVVKQGPCQVRLSASATTVSSIKSRKSSKFKLMRSDDYSTDFSASIDSHSNRAIQLTMPSFSIDSYLQLKKFHHGSKEILIEMKFQTHAENGLLFYTAQSQDGRGADFISLALIDGFLEFRYDLGSGPAILKSAEKIQLGLFHKVTATRFGKNGSLKVNEGTEVSGTSPGTLKSLNLNTPVYLGFVDNLREIVKKNVGVSVGFIGCIESLVIKSSELTVLYNLTNNDQHSSDIEKQFNVGNCDSSACASSPCLNKGICIEAPIGIRSNMKCLCVGNYSGSFCQDRIYISLIQPRTGQEILEEMKEKKRPAVAFDGQTFLRYKNQISVVDKSQTANKFEIRFRTEASNGLLLLMHKSDTVEADYLAIALRRGQVEVSFNLGKEMSTDLLVMTSPVIVTDRMWHTLVFVRTRRRAHLFVDNQHPLVTTVSSAGATHLDTDGHLWIGGGQNKVYGLPDAYSTGFHGCIESVKVNDQTLNLVKDEDSSHDVISFCNL